MGASMIIKNASVYTEEGVFKSKDIYIRDGIFTDSPSVSAGDEILDGTDCLAIPGLTDLHFHGCAGYDFCDGTAEAIAAITAYQASVGVTSIVPATMTLAEETLSVICRAAAAYVKENGAGNPRGADLCGINMEGPFVSESKKGAQNAAFIRQPDIGMFRKLNQESGGLIKLVAIAPEVEGAMAFIEAVNRETVLSVAHTAADYDVACEAFAKGASHVTHLYNAMHPFTHRAPGVVGAAADSGAEVELICDGVHIHPATVRTTFKMFGDDKIILISDSMMATGLGDGESALGGQKVMVSGNKATLADGTIAGSVTNLMDCMRTAVLTMGIPLESAIKCAAVNPAKSVGIYDRYGSITAGKTANVVLLKKEDLSLRQVVLRGTVIS